MKAITEIPLNDYRDRRRFWEGIMLTVPVGALQDALAQLPAHMREVLTTHHVNNKPFKEICVMMNRSDSTVRNYYQRGMFLLAKRLLPYL